jgi:hypothetical protein
MVGVGGRKTWFVTDDFGNQWRFVELPGRVWMYYQAPTKSHEDCYYDAWGGAKWIWWYGHPWRDAKC